MAKCNQLTPLPFKGINQERVHTQFSRSLQSASRQDSLCRYVAVDFADDFDKRSRLRLDRFVADNVCDVVTLNGVINVSRKCADDDRLFTCLFAYPSVPLCLRPCRTYRSRHEGTQ